MKLPIVLMLAVAAWAADGTVAKTPYEAIDLSIDFAARASGISLNSVSALNLGTNKDATAAIIVMAPNTPVPAVYAETARVILRVKGGLAGDNYLISVRVTKTATGEKLEGTVQLRIVAGQ